MGYEQAFQEYINATNTHDFNNVRKHLHDDALYWFTNKTCVTPSEIQAYFETTWEVIRDEEYWATDIRWLHADEQSATCVYAYHYRGIYDGKPVSGSGRATNVFKVDDDGDWKLIHEHLSSIK
ncbi:YybH family protein [Jeotgalibacillus aurantiacus]|uniref:YybH family protein n=1 Tax=Jeotgalibacillus aurantiacus TaxID=2763266 RepID=UPI001D0A3569|nr:nuclear transport factor 2 family protein [Jeotgalibacillus aurantiacus]